MLCEEAVNSYKNHIKSLSKIVSNNACHFSGGKSTQILCIFAAH
jgi:hypothetical protein